MFMQMRRLKRPRRLGGAALLVGGLLSARPSAAQDDLTQLSIESLLEIKITAASRYEQTSLTAPAAISVWTRAELTALGCRTFADAIRLIRGLHLRNDGTYSYLGTRGFQRPGDYNARVLVLLDGVRINEPIYGGSLSGTEFYLDIEAIERVEFISGASSAIYGDSAFLGVLNVITRRGAEIDGGELSGEIGSEGFLKGRFSMGGKSGEKDWFIAASGWDSAGRESVRFPAFDSTDGEVEGRSIDGEEWRGVRASLKTRSWDLSAVYTNRRRDLTIPYVGGRFGDSRSQFIDRQFQTAVTWKRQLGERTEFSATGSFGDYLFDGDYVYDYPPVTVYKELAVGRWLHAEPRVVWRGTKHTLLAGLEGQWNFRQDQKAYDVEPQFEYQDDRRSSLRVGAYVQDEWRVGEKVTLHLGGRADRYELPRPRTVFNPRGALVFNPAKHTAIKALAGQAFRAPSVYELYYFSQGVVFNPDLESERVRTYEMVVEHNPSPGFRVQASAFHYDITGLVQLALRQAGSTFQFENLGVSHARGVELEAQWKRSSFALRASVNLQEVKDEGASELAANAPRWLAKVSATKTLSGGLTAGIDLNHVSARRTGQGTTANGYSLTNLTLSRSISGYHAWGFVAGVRNLFDQRYFDPSDQDAVTDLFPLPGRALFFRLVLGSGR
jgi:outer membrane receptor protein involved in Fe transport